MRSDDQPLRRSGGRLLRAVEHSYGPSAEPVMLFSVSAWDANCPQHIPHRIDTADISRVLAERERRIAELEAEVSRLRSAANSIAAATRTRLHSALVQNADESVLLRGEAP